MELGKVQKVFCEKSLHLKKLQASTFTIVLILHQNVSRDVYPLFFVEHCQMTVYVTDELICFNRNIGDTAA